MFTKEKLEKNLNNVNLTKTSETDSTLHYFLVLNKENCLKLILA